VARFFIYGGVTEDVDTSLVETGPAIEKFVFNYVPASQAFDDIAELAGYIWYIDYENASTSRRKIGTQRRLGSRRPRRTGGT